jgi:hypothetical protein
MGDLTVIRWRAWFVGGDTIDGTTFEDWQQLPDDGVTQVLIGFRDGTAREERGDDWYFATPDGIYGHNSHPLDENRERYPTASFKRGMWTTEQELARIHQEEHELAERWLSNAR